MAKAKKEEKNAPEQSKEESIGFHKGSLAVLAKERQEMQRILAIVEQLMQMHLTELKDLGVDLSQEVEKAQKQATKKPPIDELL
ncbi:hypothetical protein CMO88_02605 [Candidatus Woesearchaeota archaeon]|nr:hypothetical protein [Candidatus Woesearchaeota archaeon]|tara:strand:- start:7473 stop:7724 length:252 start_codon:yes stop_codon:yes gene_type:complete